MKHSIHAIQLNLDGKQMAPTINIRKGDTDKTLKISIWNGLQRYMIPSNVLSVLSAKKPDGTSLYNVCKIEDNDIYYDFTDQTANCLGLIKAEIKLYTENQE